MKFLGREALRLENDTLRVTVLTKGCNIAEIFHKQAGISPLWIPPWVKEHNEASPAVPKPGTDSHFMSNVIGHHVCLDMFGEPSEEERSAGFELHGEASIVPYDCYITDDKIYATAHLEKSSLRISRSIQLGLDGNSVNFSEAVENFLPIDRPIAWTQHVTLGPPFLIPGVTRICINPTRSCVSEATMEHSPLERRADFTWPAAPSLDHSICDLSIFADRNRAASLTTHRMEGHASEASFTVFCPQRKLRFGYRWNSQDFPWLAMWEENKSRKDRPWNHETVACGLEFGVSPFPEPRRQMVDRGSLFNTPTFRWLEAAGKANVSYSAFFSSAEQSGNNEMNFRSNISK